MGVYNITKNIEKWNVNSTYDVGVIVEYNGANYEALKSVPKGINIGCSDYWKKLADIETLADNVAEIEEETALFENITTYDEDEVVVGTWFEGEPIYQRRIVKEVETGSTSTNYEVEDLTNYNIDSLIKIEGTYNIVRTGSQNDINQWASDGNRASVLYDAVSKKLQVSQTVGGGSTTTCYITLWFTKVESEG